MSNDEEILGLDNPRTSDAGKEALNDALELLANLSDKDYWNSVENIACVLDQINSRTILAEFHLHPIKENSDWLTNRILLEESSRVIKNLKQTSESLKNLLSTMIKVRSAKKWLESSNNPL